MNKYDKMLELNKEKAKRKWNVQSWQSGQWYWKKKKYPCQH